MLAVTGNARLNLKNKSMNFNKKAKQWHVGKYGGEWEGTPGALLKLRFNEDITPDKAGQRSWRDSMTDMGMTESMLYALGNLAAAITVPSHIIENTAMPESEKDEKRKQQFEEWRRDVGDDAERLINNVTGQANTTVDEKARHVTQTEALSGYRAADIDDWTIVDEVTAGSVTLTGSEWPPAHVDRKEEFTIDNYVDDDEWEDLGYNGCCIMNHKMMMITTADLQNIVGSGRFICRMCMDHINPAIDGEQFLMICFTGNCKGKYTLCKSCSCINNQERRMYTVQGILQTHAQAGALRNAHDPTIAANAMLSIEQTANLAMALKDDNAPSTKSRAIACASTRSSVTDVHSESGQGAAMITDMGGS